MKVIDLSQTTSQDMAVFPGARPPMIEQVASVEKDSYVEHSIKITTHIGTHIDSPGHIIKNGKRLIDLDINQYVGTGYVLDVSSNDKVTISDIKRIKDLQNIEFLLLYTGLGHCFNRQEYFDEFPVLDDDALSFLLEKAIRLKGIGIDSFSIDTVEPMSIKNHIEILGNGLIIIENLTNLEKLINKKFILSVLPLKVVKIEGCPVRAVALLEED